MNKSDLKNFAVNARLELLRRVSDRAALYGINETNAKDRSIAPSGSFHRLDGAVLTDAEIIQRDALIARIYQIGYRPAMEAAAYTWFNRFIAIEYMQEHNLLPVLQRVFPDAPGAQPQILREAQDVSLPGVDADTVLSLLDTNAADELYKRLLIALCNALSESLPGMFEEIDRADALLFPDALLKADSVLGEMAKLDADSWSEIQVIGWLYQYYITQRHDEVVDINGGAIPKEDIPAATCLYTTDWVVRYMVENSIGRLWLEGHPDENLRMKWRYFMDEAKQTPEAAAKLAEIRAPYASVQPEQITLLDPCMGSGHILVYAFDVLMSIYRSVGYTDRDAVRSIVENNLYGLDIDDRAAQLAYFAVMMKACEYDRRFLRRGVQPHICAIQEPASIDEQALNAFGAERTLAERLLRNFRDAKEYGSLIHIELTMPELDRLSARIAEMETSAHESLLSIAESASAAQILKPLVKQAKILARKYDIVATNPPYMNKFSKKLKEYVQANYSDFKADLFAVFMRRNFDLCRANGFSAFMSPFVWMFIKSYEKLREEILSHRCISTLIQMEYSAFEEATVPICTFVLRNSQLNYVGNYLRLSDFKGGMDIQNEMVLKAQESVECSYRYTAQQDNFKKIPGAPVAYWVSEKFFSNFTGNAIKNVCAQKTRISTGDNERFMRKWFEVSNIKVFSPNKWIPCPKGGDYRKWFGNISFVLNWENEGADLKAFSRAMLGDSSFFMKPGLTWTVISSAKTSFRVVPQGCICDHKGPLIYFFDRKMENYVLGLLNSIYSEKLLEIIAPTIGFEWGAIAKIPWKDTIIKDNRIDFLVYSNINVSKSDWDSFETSWDFKKHPMI